MIYFHYTSLIKFSKQEKIDKFLFYYLLLYTYELKLKLNTILRILTSMLVSYPYEIRIILHELHNISRKYPISV